MKKKGKFCRNISALSWKFSVEEDFNQYADYKQFCIRKDKFVMYPNGFDIRTTSARLSERRSWAN